MSKHTPGPWYVRREHDMPVVKSQTDEVPICVGSNKDQDFINARLIAAAPEMLEFLKEIHTKHNFDAVDEEEYNWLEERLENLIAKAEGRS